jgi:hypothetical protein
MKTWPQAIRDGAISGSVASAASTAVLSARGEQENGTPYAPTNAISHWVWGGKAMRRDGPSTRYTLLGYAIHHASSMFWAAFYEKYFGRKAEAKEIVPSLAGGLGVAAVACFVDYKLTPQRLQPGFEQRLSGKSLALVYGAFGLALAARGLLAYDERRARREPSKRLRNDVSSDFI